MTIQSLKQQVRDTRNRIEERAHQVEGKILRVAHNASGTELTLRQRCDLAAARDHLDELRCESNGLRFALRQLNELIDGWLK